MKRTLAGLIALLLLAGGVRADIASNLVAHWKLDETSGTSAADSAGANTGTFVGSPTLNVAGAFGASKAITSSSTAYMSTASGLGLGGGSALTMAAWIKPGESGANYRVFVGSDNTGSNDGCMLLKDTGNKFYIAVKNGASMKSVSAYSTGTWYHVVGTVADFTSATPQLYINGVLETWSTGTAISAGTTGGNMCIGRRPYSTSPLGVSATLDDVRIYSRALSAADVAELYAYTGAAKFPYWYFNSSGCDPFKVFRTRQPLAIVTTR